MSNQASIGEIFEELDQSGARADRPMLAAALDRVEAGRSQGIVVAKLDRFGRSLIDGLAMIERISAAGGVFVSVQDGLDLSTPTGRLVLRIMFSMAEWELDRVRANWDAARARAISRGVHLSSAPLGYIRAADGRLKVEQKAAALVAELFERRCEGETISSLIAVLNASGLRTSRGASSFVESSVKGILTNRTYLGEVRAGRYLKTDAHTAIVDEATWRQAQRPCRFQSNRRTSLLGGVLRCASCRMKMSVEAGVFRDHVHGGTYRCPGHTSAGACPAPARISGEEIEGLVEDFVLRSVPVRGSSTTALHRVALAEAQLEKRQEALARYRDDSGALTTLSPENFAAGLAKRQADVESTALHLAAATRAGTPPHGIPADLERSWPDLTVESRRAVIDEFLDCVFIAPGTQTATERAYVCPRGTAPQDIPRRGVPLNEIRSFKPAEHRGVVRLRAPRRWSEKRLEGELETWCGDRETWPSYVEFLLAGRATLYLRILDFGGPHFWSHRLGWHNPFRITSWSLERIHGALRPLLARREVWPSRAEFEEAGLGAARRAAIRHGGISYWAGTFGLRLGPRAAASAKKRQVHV